MAGGLVDSLRYEVGIDPGKAKRGAAQLGMLFNRISGKALFAGGAVATIGIAAALTFKKAVSEAQEFEEAWAEVSTILAATRGENEALAESIENLSARIPESAANLARGFYQTISAGILDAADASMVLEASAKAATGGLTSTFKAVDVVTTVLNAYRLTAKDATDVSDVLFTTVREGKLTFDTLADSIGIAIPFAAQVGVNIRELAAALATLTKGGLNSHIAVTALRAVLTQVLKPADEATVLAEKLGLEFSTAAIRAKGFAGFLQEVAEKTQGSEVLIAKLFPNVRGLAAVFSLAGNQADEFARILDVMNNDTLEASQKAFELIMETSSAQAKVVKNELAMEWRNLGDVLLNNVVGPFLRIIDAQKNVQGEMTESTIKLAKKVTFLNQKVGPLIVRYKELRVMTKRTVEEQEEMEKIIKSVTDAFPELIGQIDEHGKALEINIQRLRGFKDGMNKLLLTEQTETIGNLVDSWKDSRDAAKEAAESVNKVNNAHITYMQGVEGVMGGTLEMTRAWGLMTKEGKAVTGQGETQADAWKDMTENVLPAMLSEYQKLAEKQSTLADIAEREIAAIVSVAGLNEGIAAWVAWETKAEGSIELTGAKLTALQVRLQSIFENPKLQLEDIKNLLIAIDKLNKAPEEAEEKIPAAEVFSQASENAAKMFLDSLDKKEGEFRTFVEGIAGEFGTAAWESFKEDQPAVISFFKRLHGIQLRQDAARAKKAAGILARELEKRLAKGEVLTGLAQMLAGGLGVTDDFKPKFDVVQARRDLESAIIDIETSIGFIDDDVEKHIIQAGLGLREVGDLLDKVPAEMREMIARIILQMRAGGAPISDEDVTKLIGKTGDDAEEAGDQFIHLSRAMDAFARIAPGTFSAFLNNTASGLTSIFGAIKAGAGPLGIATAGLGLFAAIIESTFGPSSAMKRAELRTRVFDDELEKLADTMSEFRGIAEEDPAKELNDKMKALQKALRVLEETSGNFFDIGGGMTQEGQAAIKSLEELFRQAGLNPDLVSDFINLGDIEGIFDLINNSIDITKESLRELAQFVVESFGDMMDQLNFAFDFFDIEKPREQIKLLLDELFKLTGLDLSAIGDLGAEEMEKVIENIGGLVTGLIPGLDEMLENRDATGRLILAGKTIPGMAELQEIAEILGLTKVEVLKLLEGLLLESGLNGDEIKELLGEIENMNDSLKEANEIGDDNLTISRSVNITEQQGDTIIALFNSFSFMVRDIMDNVRGILVNLQNINSTGKMGSIVNHITVHASGSPEVIGRRVAIEVSQGVESSLRGKGFKLIGQGR